MLPGGKLDCVVASLLAMTIFNGGHFSGQYRSRLLRNGRHRLRDVSRRNEPLNTETR